MNHFAYLKSFNGRLRRPISRFMLCFALLVLAPHAASSEERQPPAFVDAATLVEGLALEMRYADTNNFVGTRIDGYEAPRCLLTRPAATALAKVQRDLAER